MSAPITYRLSHITDVADVPEEHWDEMALSIRMAMASAKLMHALMREQGCKLTLAQLCPEIRYTADGVAGSTMDLGKGCEIVITKEAAP